MPYVRAVHMEMWHASLYVLPLSSSNPVATSAACATHTNTHTHHWLPCLQLGLVAELESVDHSRRSAFVKFRQLRIDDEIARERLEVCLPYLALPAMCFALFNGVAPPYPALPCPTLPCPPCPTRHAMPYPGSIHVSILPCGCVQNEQQRVGAVLSTNNDRFVIM